MHYEDEWVLWLNDFIDEIGGEILTGSLQGQVYEVEVYVRARGVLIV